MDSIQFYIQSSTKTNSEYRERIEGIFDKSNLANLVNLVKLTAYRISKSFCRIFSFDLNKLSAKKLSFKLLIDRFRNFCKRINLNTFKNFHPILYSKLYTKTRQQRSRMTKLTDCRGKQRVEGGILSDSSRKIVIYSA